MSDNLPIKPGHEGLVGHDPAAPAQDGILKTGFPPGDHRWNDLASFSAEATARFMASGDPADLGKPAIHDERVKAGIARQHVALRRTLFNGVVPALADAMRKDSAQAARRLEQLSQQAHAGDQRASQLLAVLIGELLTWAMQP